MRLSHLFGVLCLVVLSAVTAPVWACGDCAGRYEKLADSRRLQADIDYLLPDDPLELDRRKRKRKVDEDEDEGGINLSRPGQIGWLLISGVVLAGLIFVIYQNSAGGLISFSRVPQDAKKRREAAAATPYSHDDMPKSETAFLAEIERMADRRKALHLLSERLLSRAADKAGIRQGRSWTARESLRALPRDMAHLADLRLLNRHAELAWFGGRAVDDGLFEDCMARARAMMGRGVRP